ncbi:MBL fold metallo-hydrolase [bacterium]|nr:MBL fold metallo-hydrolase [bacterium]
MRYDGLAIGFILATIRMPGNVLRGEQSQMITLGFYGAAGEVTGSCYLVTTDRARVIVDLGMHQGEPESDRHNHRLPRIKPEEVDALVLTHAHLDHCGRLPLFTKYGYHGPIHCTVATAELTDIILRDSAAIQMEDCAQFNRRLRRGQEPAEEPLYDLHDVERTLRLIETIDYQCPKEIADGITITFFDSGHILGAASVQMKITDGNRTITVVFSGDIGLSGSPILRDPVTPTPADVVLMETTYGDRDHKPLDQTRDELLAVLKAAHSEEGKILIPAFAVGRTQDLVYHIGQFVREGELPLMPVYVDSPMATSVSRLYSRHRELYDEQAQHLIANDMEPLLFPGLTYTRTVEESRLLNKARGPMVIIAASGMCTGGRILHHLFHGLSHSHTQVVIVGYQGRGTLGRRLVDKARNVQIFRENVPVRAKIHTLGGFSAHAGQSGLLAWAEPYRESRPRVFLTHGEEIPRQMFHDKLLDRLGIEATMPNYGDEIEL